MSNLAIFSVVNHLFLLLLLFSTFPERNLFASSQQPSFYSSTNTIKVLARKEQILLPVLVKYKQMLKKQQQSIKSIIDEIYSNTIKNSNSKFKIGNETIIDWQELADETTGHPFKSYFLIKRFVKSWPSVHEMLMNVSKENEVLKNTRKKLEADMFFPDSGSLVDTMTSLVKLKGTYNLPATSLVKGIFKGLATNSGLNPQHCFELGKYALRYQIFTSSIDLLYEGLKLAQGPHKGVKWYEKSEIEQDLESLLQLAINRHDSKLENGTFEKMNNPFHYRRKLENYTSPAFRSKIPIKLIPEITNASNIKGLFRAYESLCDGKILKTPQETKDLVCKLENRKNFVHPYFRLQPVKIEFHHQDPILIQIHDVLSPKEIEKIIEAAQPRMTRSLVVGTNDTKLSHIGRTSSNTFLNDYEIGSPFNYISRRIEKLVGLRASVLEASEDLQVANYGPGEYYAPHFDGGDRDEELERLIPFQKFRGDRLATFMIYLNGVEKGGSTAFPRLGVAVRPEKGSGVFWFNLRHDGSQEPFSLHAGCPVLYGTKWIANKWIRANEQIFTRKCPLIEPIKRK